MKTNKILLFFVLSVLLLTITNAQNQEDYDWSQVRIGGGGYITGMQIHPNNSEVRYYRTDVGGAYRWDPNKQELVQILNYNNGSYYGVAGIALHPTRENIIYLATDRGNTTGTSRILYSENYGSTWTEIDVTSGIKFGANGGREGGSGINDLDREGNCLAINPNNPNELFVGTREKGLWVLDLTKSQKWRKINSIPDNTKEASIRTVVFHPVNPNVVYVGYAQFGVYRSTNGGASFTLINNGFNDIEDVADLSLSKNGTKLYAALRNKGVYRLTSPTNSMAWEKLNIPNANLFRGYHTVTASPHDDNLVVAAPTAPGGTNLGNLQVSTNSGTTWTRKSNVDVETTYKWRSTSNAGAYVSQLAFDPEDPDKLYLTCWFGLWHTDDWDANQVVWRNDRSKGHEEIVNTGLKTFPANTTNNTLVVNSADSPAIVSTDTDSYDNVDIHNITNDDSDIVKGQDISICESFPNNYAISATQQWNDSNGGIIYTTNGGLSYTKMTGYSGSWGKSLIGTSADNPSNIVAVHGNQIHYTNDRGVTFNAANYPSLSEVVPNGVFIIHDPLTEDLVLSNTFYLYDRSNGHVIRSTNGGKDWSKTNSNLPTDSQQNTRASLHPAPNRAGHLWFNSPEQGLYFSSNQGDNWTRVSSVKKARILALGKAMTENGYPTVYMIGELTGNSEEALLRSTDQGATWTEISNASTQFLLASPRYMAADRNEFGKVYVGLSGLGVFQGASQGTDLDPDFIEVTAPTAAEELIIGSDYEIKWNTNAGGTVRIALWKAGNYLSEVEASIPNNGSYTWSVPSDLEAASDYQIRVRSNENDTISDFNENFNVIASCAAAETTCDDGDANTVNDVEDGNCNCAGVAAFITVTSPIATDVIETVSTHTVLWNSNLSGNVRIALWKGNNYHSEIVASIPNNGSYTWSVPSNLAAADDYRVRVRGFENDTIDDYSENFSITIPCPSAGTTCDDGDANTVNDVEDGNCTCAGVAAFITVTSPIASSAVITDNMFTVVWNSNQPGDVRIELYKDGNSISQIIASTPNNGVFNWSVSSDLEVANDYQIRIISLDNTTISDLSEIFAIGNSCAPTGTSCNDGNANTINDVFDANCNCIGTFADDDNDGVGNADDVCPDGDDTIDTDSDGTPDACDTCDNTLEGTSCDDGNTNTINDVFDADCNCLGEEAEEETDEEETDEEETDEEETDEEVEEIENKISIYPNPSSSYVTIHYGLLANQENSWTLFDLSGKMMKRGTGQEIDIQELSSGVYIIIIEESGKEIKRMMLLKK